MLFLLCPDSRDVHIGQKTHSRDLFTQADAQRFQGQVGNVIAEVARLALNNRDSPPPKKAVTTADTLPDQR